MICETNGRRPLARPSWLGLRGWLAVGMMGTAMCLMADPPSGASPDSGPKKRPNILFIMSDDHAYQAIGAYGSRINTTPHIDRIASEGMRFDRCYVTNSICGPCRAVILTGKYSHLNGFRRNGYVFDGSQPTVAKMLQQAGYQTALVGKWHLESTPTGFDHYQVLVGQGPYYNPVLQTPGGNVKHTGYTTDIITDEAIKYLSEARDEDRPFFLMVHHKAPHRNWMPGPAHLSDYEEETIPEPETLFDDYKNRADGARTQEMTIERHLTPLDLKLAPQPSMNDEQRAVWRAAYEPRNRAFREANLTGDDLVRWKYQRYIKDYLRCIASVDDSVGRLLGEIERQGLTDDTVVIYTSDQGFYLGEHGWFDKRWMYEESFRTPFVIKWPGVIEPGRTTDALAMNLDFAETFLTIAGQPVPDSMQGVSLTPLLAGDTPTDWRTSLYYHYYEFPGPHSVPRHFGVSTDRHKLIYYYQLGQWELFDLQADPREMRSVHDDPAYAEVRAALWEELSRKIAEYADHEAAERLAQAGLPDKPSSP